MEGHHSRGEAVHVVLKREVPIDAQKRVELAFGKGQQRAVPFAAPPHLGHGPASTSVRSGFRHLGKRAADLDRLAIVLQADARTALRATC